MLKLQVDSLDELPEAMREHYSQAEDGAFELQIEGAGSLRNALEFERRHRRNAENRARELETQVRNARNGLPPPKPESEMTPKERFLAQAEQRLAKLAYGSEEYAAELDRLRKEMEPLISAEVAEHDKQRGAELARLSADHDRIFIEHAARDICGDIGLPGHGDALLPHVSSRLAVKREDGKAVLVVLDREGKPSSATMDALKQELRETQAFKPVLRDAVADEARHQRLVAEMLGTDSRSKSLTRSAFDKLSTASQARHIRAGREVVDDVH
jgi:hypothetical protein